MQINKINILVPNLQNRTSFKGHYFDVGVRTALDSSFRDDELYDYARDKGEDLDKKYDSNDVPLSLAKYSLPIPADYMMDYELRDARFSDVDPDPYHNYSAPLDVLDGPNRLSVLSHASINEELTLQWLSMFKDYQGETYYDGDAYGLLKAFSQEHPSKNQVNIQFLANVCTLDKYDTITYFSKPIYDMAVRTCENLKGDKVLARLLELKGALSVAKLKKADGSQYWDSEVIDSFNYLNKNRIDIPLHKQRQLIKACIVPDKVGNEKFLHEAFGFANSKVKNPTPEIFDAIIYATKSGVVFDEENNHYVFSNDLAKEHYVKAKEAIKEGREFDCDLPV